MKTNETQQTAKKLNEMHWKPMITNVNQHSAMETNGTQRESMNIHEHQKYETQRKQQNNDNGYQMQSMEII